ncbi:MAG: hypothetical protein C0429_17350 [Sphingopyxis sp.]|nr:hypothetical protein [Sphingopyxis sp.]
MKPQIDPDTIDMRVNGEQIYVMRAQTTHTGMFVIHTESGVELAFNRAALMKLLRRCTRSGNVQRRCMRKHIRETFDNGL